MEKIEEPSIQAKLTVQEVTQADETVLGTVSIGYTCTERQYARRIIVYEICIL